MRGHDSGTGAWRGRFGTGTDHRVLPPLVGRAAMRARRRQVARVMARGVDRRSVEADIRVTNPIRSGVAPCVEALDLGGVRVGVEGRSWAASASGDTWPAATMTKPRPHISVRGYLAMMGGQQRTCNESKPMCAKVIQSTTLIEPTLSREQNFGFRVWSRPFLGPGLKKELVPVGAPTGTKVPCPTDSVAGFLQQKHLVPVCSSNRK